MMADIVLWFFLGQQIQKPRASISLMSPYSQMQTIAISAVYRAYETKDEISCRE